MAVKVKLRTEDEVGEEARLILGLDIKVPNIQQETGQISTFNQLGFKGVKINQMVGIYLKTKHY